MKEKKHIYSLAAKGVVSVDCELFCGSITVTGSPDDNFRIERNFHSHIKISRNNGVVRIKQFAKPVFHRAKVVIFVPSCCIPDITVALKQGGLRIENGKYGDLRVKTENAEIALCRSDFVNADIICKQMKLNCSDITVTSSLDLSSEVGDALMENCVCSKTDLVCKDGNVGVSRLKCPDSTFLVERGSVSVNLYGSEREFRTDLLTRRGTCNRASSDSGKNTLKVYSDSGNIIVDFTDGYKENGYGNDYVAENSRLARGA